LLSHSTCTEFLLLCLHILKSSQLLSWPQFTIIIIIITIIIVVIVVVLVITVKLAGSLLQITAFHPLVWAHHISPKKKKKFLQANRIFKTNFPSYLWSNNIKELRSEKAKHETKKAVYHYSYKIKQTIESIYSSCRSGLKLITKASHKYYFSTWPMNRRNLSTWNSCWNMLNNIANQEKAITQ
jgi:hypothetical protein